MDLYYLPGSAPCRAVQLTARALGIDLNLKVLNVMAGEQMKPDFVKINPQHTIPTLVDGEFVLWESRAIMIYLVEKYGSKDDTLYPKLPKDRAVINQRLYFDMGTIYESLANYYYPIFLEKKEPVPEDLKKAENAIELFNTLLEGHEYAAGDNITLADLALVASVSTFEAAGFDYSKYPLVDKWLKNCKENIVGYEINQEGIEQMIKCFTGGDASE